MGTKRSPSGSWCLVAVLVVLLSISGFVEAQVTLTWNLAGPGSWHDPNNWDPNRDRRPTEYDTAIIDQGEGRILTENAEAAEVYLGQSAGSTGRLLLSNGMDLASALLYVGYGGTGNFTQ